MFCLAKLSHPSLNPSPPFARQPRMAGDLQVLLSSWRTNAQGKHREVVEVNRTTEDVFTAHLPLMSANVPPVSL